MCVGSAYIQLKINRDPNNRITCISDRFGYGARSVVAKKVKFIKVQFSAYKLYIIYI
jgi:hypothetical protein